MGMDFLDFSLRIQKSLGLHIGRDDYARLGGKKMAELTAGELHVWVVQLCRDKSIKVPWSRWTRVRLELAKTVGKPPQIIHPNTLAVRDLGFG